MRNTGRRRGLQSHIARAISPYFRIEHLEGRRLLCIEGVDEPGTSAEEVHLYDAEGHHLLLDGVPDAATVDIVPAPSATFVGPLQGVVRAASDTASVVAAPTGGLNGKVVYVNGGHGWTWNGTSWNTQRPEYQNIVEDFGTQDQITFYSQYLLNAGATVMPIRPLGHQLNEVIVDNNDPGFTTQGAWSFNSASSTYWSNVNGDDTGNRYRFASVSATETAVARFTPTIPQAGFYPVYAWWNNGSNRSTEALYRINSAGGSQEVKVNQRYTGKGWAFLGIYYFDAGTGGNVEVSNKASNGSAVIADAVRFGNGMGDWHGDDIAANAVSGKPREEELSLYWAYRSRGYTGPKTIVSPTFADGGNASDATAGVGTPPRWSAYMNDESQGTNLERIFLSFHSNGSTGLPDATARGTEALTNTSAPTINQSWWANAISEEVEEDMQALPAGMIEHTWASRTNVFNGVYGEISSNSAGQEFSTTLLEVAFHDNLSDSDLLRDPKARDYVARASYQATAKYFNNFAGTTATLLPDPPTASRATTDAAGNVILNWTAPGTGAANGGAGAASGYKIYYGANGYSWSDAKIVGNVTSYTFAPGTLPAGAMTYFKIVATNAGGESFQRDVVAAKPQSGRRAPILIVNGFDRLDRTTDDTEAYAGGSIDRVRYRYQNTRDFVTQFAEAVEAYNPALGVETVQNEQVINGTIDLANYQTVLWISGEESTADKTFDPTERALIAAYLASGGKLFVSGAEIGWDLDASGADPAFYNNQLGAKFVVDDAGTYTTNGVAGSIFAGINSVVFDDGADLATGSFLTYDVETPDVIATSNGSTAALKYSTGTTAAVQFSSGDARVVTMGFPFETIKSVSKRNSVMAGVLTFFGINSTLTSAIPGTPDLLPASDSGPLDTDNVTNRDNSSAGKTLQFSVSGTVAGATVSLFADGTFIGSAVASGTTTTVTTNGTVDLADGARSITARQTEPGKSESADSGALGITIKTTAPTVTQVFVGSTGWTPNFNNFLVSSDAGEAAFGLRILASEQTDELPWTNLNTVSIRFSENVNVAQDDLNARGVNVSTYAVQSFAYDASTFTATWTLTTTGIANDKLLLELDADAGGVTDSTAGNALDGEWTNPVAPAISGDAYPSGDGSAGGDFLFRLNVLPGDVNRSGGSVTGSDVTLVRNAQNFSPGTAGYSILKDVNGSGSILGSDVTLVRNRQGISLPAGEPIVPASQIVQPQVRRLQSFAGIIVFTPPPAEQRWGRLSRPLMTLG